MAEPEPRFSSAEVLDMLESAPTRIAAATSGVPAQDLIEPLTTYLTIRERAQVG